MYKWTKKEKTFIKNLIKEGVEKLNLQSWEVKIDFIDGKVLEEHTSSGSYTIDAESRVTREYYKTTILFYPSVLKNLRDGNQNTVRVTVFHELAHCLVQALWELGESRFTTRETLREEAEKLTQKIAVITAYV